MKFIIFQPGFDAQKFEDFINNHIILKDKYLENGTVYVYYKEIGDIGQQPIDYLESIDRQVTVAEKDIFTATQDLTENHQALADVEERISQMTPNDVGWKDIQSAKVQLNNAIILSEKTIETRKKQIDNLRMGYQSVVIDMKAAKK